MKKTENMKTKYRKLKDRRKDYVHLYSIIPYQSPAVRSCVNILYTMHLPYCPSPSVNGCLTCFLRWSIPFTEPAAKAFLRCVNITFLISLVLLEFSLVLWLYFCLPSSLTFSLSLFCFLSPSCSLKPDQLALDGLLLAPVRPDFTLSSLGLSAGRELGDRSLKGRIPDGRWHAGHACMWQGLAQGSGGPAAAVTHQYWGC